MRNRNLLFNFLTLLITIGFVFLVVTIGSSRYTSEDNLASIILTFAIFSILVGFICTLIHELGHFIFGKANGFKLISITIWFFKWYLDGKKYKFSFTIPTEEFGSTEMIPLSNENLEKRFSKLTMGGLIFSAISILIGIPALFLDFLPLWAYALWSVFLPIGAYVFFGNFLPISEHGARNDGAVFFGLKNNDDISKVTISLLKIHSELFNGKTPSEIDDKYLYDLPQLPEDDSNFIMLLYWRYLKFLDQEDYEKGIKVLERLLTLEEYFSKDMYNAVKTEAVFAYSTFSKDVEKADMSVYEIEKYLNNTNNSSCIRAKLAYILIEQDFNETADMFYNKGIKECLKTQIKGLATFEKKLLDKLKK